MTATGKFLVSLDCEGKWGQADKLDPQRAARLTTGKLLDSYQFLVDALGRFEVPATFAFVEVFTYAPEDRRECEDLLRPHHPTLRDWFGPYADDALRGSSDGWFLPEAVQMVEASGLHEVGSHGFSHLPISCEAVLDGAAEEDFRSLRTSFARRNKQPRTFVYPRNIVNAIHLVEEAGFVGFREGCGALPGPMGRGRALLDEFHLFAVSQSPREPSLPLVIPGGFFLNSFTGLRNLVPMPVLVRRWKSIIAHAARTGGVAHLWLHPHNCIDSPRTRQAFCRVLEYAAGLASEGRLELATLESYCSAA